MDIIKKLPEIKRDRIQEKTLNLDPLIFNERMKNKIFIELYDSVNIGQISMAEAAERIKAVHQQVGVTSNQCAEGIEAFRKLLR